MKYALLALLALLICSCGSAPNRTGDVADDGTQGAIVEVKHRGKIYIIWHHDGYQSECAVLLDSYPDTAK